MAQQRNSKVAICPECDGPLKLNGTIKVGQRLACQRCGSTLVITERKPLDLVLANGIYPVRGHVKADKKNKMYKGDEDPTSGQLWDYQEDPLMSTTARVSMADCPECNASLRFRKSVKAGQLIVCPECDETLVVVSPKPLELDWADEDPWDYEDHDDIQYSSRYGVS